MMGRTPPRWLERILLNCLPARDRETISGDLLEEYREEQLPRFGSVRANFWYLRQLVSFISLRGIGGPPMKTALMSMSLFTAATGVWLAVMENILKHAGYGGRAGVGACIAAQGLATLLFAVFDGRSLFRALVVAGAVALGLLGGFAIQRMLDAPHFEGFVLIAGCLLIAQCGLTIGWVLRSACGRTQA